MIDFINNLRDSKIIKCALVEGIVVITIEDFDDCIWDVRIRTDAIQYSSTLFNSGQIFGVRGKIYELVKEIEISSGIYVAPKDIPTLSLHARLGISLAYGKRATEFKYLACLLSSLPLISCLIKDVIDVSITEQN